MIKVSWLWLNQMGIWKEMHYSECLVGSKESKFNREISKILNVLYKIIFKVRQYFEKQYLIKGNFLNHEVNNFINKIKVDISIICA